MKNRSVAILLALFLGWMGAHRFYLGHGGVGLIYLLFSWTGIPMLLGIVEALIYAVTPEVDFQMKYGKL